MSYCLNPDCQKPQNPVSNKFCQNCGARLLLGDRYRAIQPIGQSGMGRTFLAVDEFELSKLRCVIKQFLPKNQGTGDVQKAVELFRQEAARLLELSQHPQIPQVLAYFDLQERQYLVQQLIEGQNLEQKLAIDGAFSEAEIRQLLIDILPVLQFVHDRSYIHRDINPENIIRRSSDRQLFLVDFGAAKFTTKTALAKTGTLIGSAGYAAPEQLMGKAVPTSDLYSLGVTCIHLLTQMHPFELYSSWEGAWVWQDYLDDSIGDRLRQILNKMLDATVRNRYQSAAEILKDLNSDPNQVTFVQLIPTAPLTVRKSLTSGWNCVRTLRGHFNSIQTIALSSKGQDKGTPLLLASGSADQKIKIWNLDGTDVDAIALDEHSNLISAVAFGRSVTSLLLASGSWDRTIKIWDLGSGKDAASIALTHEFCEHSGWILCLAISSDGQTFASSSADKTIKIWHLEKGVIRTLSGHSSAVHSVAFSLDGKTIVSSSADKTIKIWNLDGELLHTLEGHTNSVDAVTISPGGKILASGSADKTIKIWHLGNGKLLGTYIGHADAVKSVAFSLDGQILISGSTDKTIKIWHSGSGELLHTLAEHSGAVNAVAISGDGKTIASGSQDKTIKIWQRD